eukprot:gene10475-8438_t
MVSQQACHMGEDSLRLSLWAMVQLAQREHQQAVPIQTSWEPSKFGQGRNNLKGSDSRSRQQQHLQQQRNSGPGPPHQRGPPSLPSQHHQQYNRQSGRSYVPHPSSAYPPPGTQASASKFSQKETKKGGTSLTDQPEWSVAAKALSYRAAQLADSLSPRGLATILLNLTRLISPTGPPRVSPGDVQPPVVPAVPPSLAAVSVLPLLAQVRAQAEQGELNVQDICLIADCLFKLAFVFDAAVEEGNRRSPPISGLDFQRTLAVLVEAMVESVQERTIGSPSHTSSTDSTSPTSPPGSPLPTSPPGSPSPTTHPASTSHTSPPGSTSQTSPLSPTSLPTSPPTPRAKLKGRWEISDLCKVLNACDRLRHRPSQLWFAAVQPHVKLLVLPKPRVKLQPDALQASSSTGSFLAGIGPNTSTQKTSMGQGTASSMTSTGQGRASPITRVGQNTSTSMTSSEQGRTSQKNIQGKDTATLRTSAGQGIGGQQGAPGVALEETGAGAISIEQVVTLLFCMSRIRGRWWRGTAVHLLHAMQRSKPEELSATQDKLMPCCRFALKSCSNASSCALMLRAVLKLRPDKPPGPIWRRDFWSRSFCHLSSASLADAYQLAISVRQLGEAPPKWWSGTLASRVSELTAQCLAGSAEGTEGPRGTDSTNGGTYMATHGGTGDTYGGTHGDTRGDTYGGTRGTYGGTGGTRGDTYGGTHGSTYGDTGGTRGDTYGGTRDTYGDTGGTRGDTYGGTRDTRGDTYGGTRDTYGDTGGTRGDTYGGTRDTYGDTYGGTGGTRGDTYGGTRDTYGGTEGTRGDTYGGTRDTYGDTYGGTGGTRGDTYGGTRDTYGGTGGTRGDTYGGTHGSTYGGTGDTYGGTRGTHGGTDITDSLGSTDSTGSTKAHRRAPVTLPFTLPSSSPLSGQKYRFLRGSLVSWGVVHSPKSVRYNRTALREPQRVRIRIGQRKAVPINRSISLRDSRVPKSHAV